MATLHILSNSAAAASCAHALGPEDRVVLLADGARAVAALATAKAARIGVVCEAEDAAAMPVPPKGVQRLSYRDFVDWVVACERSVTWT